jgi:hypothetical protein
MSFFQKQRTGRKIRSCLGFGSSRRGEDVGKGCRRVNMVEIICTHVRNGKLRPLETIPGIEGGGIKEKDGGGKFNYAIL